MIAEYISKILMCTFFFSLIHVLIVDNRQKKNRKILHVYLSSAVLVFFLIHDFPTSKHKTKASLSVTREVSHKRNAESGNKVMET